MLTTNYSPTNYIYIYIYIYIYYKKLFLRKKSNRPRAALDLAIVEKGEVIPDNTAPNSYLPLFVKNYHVDAQYEFGDQL